MSLLFSRINRLRSFQLMQRHKNKIIGRLGGLPEYALFHPSRSPPSCLLYKRNLSTSDIVSDDEDIVGISPELQSCILTFVSDGSLSQDESKSISNALFRTPDGRNIVASRDLNDMKDIIQKSVDSYLVQKMKRIESGRQAISNPGNYVRSIVKRDVENKPAAPMDAKKNVNLDNVHTSASFSQQEPRIDREDAISLSELQELLRFNYIQESELNENCLHALLQNPVSTVKYSLETYSKQKKRREENGTKGITNPGSYVMAVLR
jgi:hypothetical protein